MYLKLCTTVIKIPGGKQLSKHNIKIKICRESYICLLSLHVGEIRVAAPATLRRAPSATQKIKEWEKIQTKSKLFLVAAQQINKHLEAFRVAH